MVEFEQKEQYNFQDLLRIMELLRAPGGCPWDREQDHKSIRRNLIEETYEVIEAIDNEDFTHLKEELGDVLLQVVFHTEMEREKGIFDIGDVCDGICKKLIFRHPHIFGNVEVSDSNEVLRNWDALKRVEKSQKTTTDSMVSVARSLPQLIRAEKIQAKAAKVGFDWENARDAMQKVQEEVEELSQALTDESNIEEELGDLLFATVNVARLAKVEPEQALEKTSDKFITRFSWMEKYAETEGKLLEQMTLADLDKLWEKAKQEHSQIQEDTNEEK